MKASADFAGDSAGEDDEQRAAPSPKVPAARPPWSVFRAALADAGFRPSKALGQNFLLDGNMARSLVADAGVGPGDRVLEVGAGCGFLTLHLAESGARVLAVEVDRRLFEVASRLLAGWENVVLLRADALAGKHALAPELVKALAEPGPWHVVANLPYSISGPLLVLLSRVAAPPATMSVLLQRELAEKAAGVPGTPAFGALAARLAVRYERRLGRRVPANLFWPRPRVESQVLHLALLPGGGPSPAALAGYDIVVDALFQGRRKTLRSSLAGRLRDPAAAEAALERSGLSASKRPDELTPAEILALATALGDALSVLKRFPRGSKADPS